MERLLKVKFVGEDKLCLLIAPSVQSLRKRNPMQSNAKHTLDPRVISCKAGGRGNSKMLAGRGCYELKITQTRGQ